MGFSHYGDSWRRTTREIPTFVAYPPRCGSRVLLLFTSRDKWSLLVASCAFTVPFGYTWTIGVKSKTRIPITPIIRVWDQWVRWTMSDRKESPFFRFWESLCHDFRCFLVFCVFITISICVISGGSQLFYYIYEGQSIRKLELQLESDKLQKEQRW